MMMMMMMMMMMILLRRQEWLVQFITQSPSGYGILTGEHSMPATLSVG